MFWVQPQFWYMWQRLNFVLSIFSDHIYPGLWSSEYDKPYIPAQTRGRLIKWPSAITRLTAHFLNWSLVWWFAGSDKSMVEHDTKCSHCDQVSLNNTKTQSKTLTTSPHFLQCGEHEPCLLTKNPSPQWEQVNCLSSAAAQRGREDT